MPLSGLSVNNPQEQNPIAAVNPNVGYNTITYSGNVLGSGSSGSADGGLSFSSILLYGAIGLFAVWILKRIGE